VRLRLLAAGGALGALLALSAAAPSQAATCDGTIRATTGNFSYEVVTIRGVTCRRAKQVATAYERGGTAPNPWQCFLARQSDAPRLFSCGWGASSGDVRSWPHAFEARRARPRTRIVRTRVSVDGTFVRARVRICGRRGRARFRFRETASPPGSNQPVFASALRTTTRAHPSRCRTHRFRWRFLDKFAGAARYRVAVRAKTTGRRWSRVAVRFRDTFD
jgi:hypothetical protein